MRLVWTTDHPSGRSDLTDIEQLPWQSRLAEVFPPSTPFNDGFGSRLWKARSVPYYDPTVYAHRYTAGQWRGAFDTEEDAKAWAVAMVALYEGD